MSTQTKSKPASTKRDVKATRVRPVTDRKPSAAAIRAAAMQRRIGFAFGTLGASITALSLSHLAEGVQLVCHRPAWEAWSVASAIDIGFVLTEVAPFMVPAAASADTKLARWAFSAASLCATACFNAHAFATNSPSPAIAMAIGIAIPAAIAYCAHMAGRFIIGRAH